MSVSANANPDLPVELSLNVAAGSDQDYELWRWSLSPLWDADVATADSRASFSFHSHSYIFGSASIGANRVMGSTRFRRTRCEIAKSGGEQIMVVSYDAGDVQLSAGRSDSAARTHVRPGAVAFVDLSRPADIRAATNTAKACLLPRRMLENLATRPDDLHGMVIETTQPMSVVLRAHLNFLFSQAVHLTATQRQHAVEAMAHLVAACVGPTSHARERVADAVSSVKFRQIREAIDAHLSNPTLGPDYIAKTFHVSRASLYRMFEPLGGIAAYIQRRRLLRAHRELTDPLLFERRVSEIADRWGFTTHTAFSRAYRTQYGVQPTEARIQARHVFREAKGPHHLEDSAFRTLNRWLMGLPAANA